MPRKTKKEEVLKTMAVQEYKPSMYFNSDSVMPKHIDKAQVGQKVKFVVEGTVISKSERNDAFSNGKRKSAEIEIDKVKPTKPNTAKKMDKKKK